MQKSICVYCSSSSASPQIFFDAAISLGTAIVKNGYTLVYGGVDVGLMGAVADAVKKSNGYIVGVVPKELDDRSIGSKIADEVIVTANLRERKAVMEQRADAFIGLPGGFGTLEEVLEIITLKQLHIHDKPIVLLNIDNAFQGLIEQFNYSYKNKLIKPEYSQLYYVAKDVNEAVKYIIEYKSLIFGDKWF